MIRLRVLLVIPAALALLAAFYVPRQLAQHAAISGLKEVKASVRTQPIPIPWVQDIFGEEYAQEVFEAYLSGSEFSDESLAPLKNLKSLQKLELTNSPITSAGMNHLSGLTGLYTLHLGGTKVTDDGLKNIRSMRNLGILSLGNTPISDAGLAHLVPLTSLEHLFLDYTQITDKGLETLSKLTRLKELTLTNTQITDAGVDHLKKLVNLEILRIYDTKISKQKMEELDEALPHCMLWVPTPGQ